MQLTRSVFILLFTMAVTSCQSIVESTPRTDNAPLGQKVASSRDYWPTKDWKESTPAEQGMNADLLKELKWFLEDQAGIRSVVVVRRGYLVFEHYRPGLGQNHLHSANSVTKSVTSMLVGIALSERHLRDPDQKIADFLPEVGAPDVDPKVKEITLKHLLTMTSGFEWDEQAIDDCKTDCSRFGYDSDNRINFALKRPLARLPGQAFTYDSHASHLLSVILTRATNMSEAQFAERYLFGPLGISDYYWPKDRQGYNQGSYGLRLRARDMAKIGYLYLNRGVWEGKQLISSAYVDASTRTYKQTAGGYPAVTEDYGYLWWLTTTRDKELAYIAHGFGGQYIYVVPKLDLVVAVTSNSDASPKPIQRVILGRFIIPAVSQ